MSDAPDPDPLDPRRWTARGGEGGPITGDEYAYLKDILHRQMGVGNWEPGDHDPAPPPAAPERRRGWFARLFRR